MKLHGFIFTVLCAMSFSLAAQENVGTPLKSDPARTTTSTTPLPTGGNPSWISPSSQPGFDSHVDLPSRLDLTPRDLADSVAAYSLGASMDGMMPDKPHYDFSMDPYSRNWSRSGVMAMPGGGYLVGRGGYSAMPALGNIGSASLQWMQPLGDRLTVGVGVSGNKYHFDRSIWNDYSISASARYRISDRFALKAWGSYYVQPMFHSMAALPYMGSSNYGASLDMKLFGPVGLELGAQRYMDPLTGRWRTVPVIAPSINVGGQPLSIDLGGLVGNFFESMSHKNDYKEPIDPMKSYDPKRGVINTNVNAAMPPGFNPHSPVRIPDALRR